jgi:hypothetical protein
MVRGLGSKAQFKAEWLEVWAPNLKENQPKARFCIDQKFLSLNPCIYN